MSFSEDDEIREDFLIEAGEILEQLSEQLVELEQSPDDTELLNAIFRGFHTVKGGAGFLQFGPLVDCCHVTESLFDLLRTGEREVSPDLTDVMLQVLDQVNGMFEQIRSRSELSPADPAMMARLQSLLDNASPNVAPLPVTETAEADDREDISEDEFEQLLDALQGPEPTVQKSASAASGIDEITEDEFEALLDSLEEKRRPGGENTPGAAAAAVTDSAATSPVSSAASSAASADEISEAEFEALLDDLHGPGAHQGRPDRVESEAPAAASPAPGAGTQAAKTRTPAVDTKSPAVETTVRVDTRRLDEIMNLVGELVLVRNRLVRIGLSSKDEAMSRAVGNLDIVTADLQSSVMKTRMQPIKKVFGRFPRVVRDLARNLNKEVALELRGEETGLDKNLVEALADPLIHLVRNSVDHGIEQPEQREKNGKPRQGNVLLAAEQEGDHILLSITDDGAGMDPAVLRARAIDKGILDHEAAARLSESDCFDLIFAPGFSTKTEVSSVSGRGVGMDVVKTKITQLNGSISIHSVRGEGTRIEIKVPLTLAIMPTLMVLVGEQAFALPLVSVNEIFQMDLRATNFVDGQEVVTIRNKAIPLFHLNRWLVGAEEDSGKAAHVVIVAVGNQHVGLVVDQLIGQEEVVIKPLGKMLHGTPGMAGATITGDGRIALILDVPGLIQRYAG